MTRSPIQAGTFTKGDQVYYIGPSFPEFHNLVGTVVVVRDEIDGSQGIWVEFPPGGMNNTILIRTLESVDGPVVKEEA